MAINPASNNQVKMWKKLAMGKFRKREGRFIAEGERCVEQITGNRSVTVESILIQENVQLPVGLKSSGVPVYLLSDDDFLSVTDTENPQGIAAVCVIPGEGEFQELAALSGLMVAFDSVQDPGNLGTMIRTASWFGVNGLIFGEGTVDPFHPKVVRSTAGSTGTIPYIRGSLNILLNDLELNGYTVYLLDGSEKSVSLKKVEPGDKSVVVIGNEANGIHKNLFKENRRGVRIDGTSDNVESLNAAVALSIGLWHFRDVNCEL